MQFIRSSNNIIWITPLSFFQAFQKELNKRSSNVNTVRKAAKELMGKSGEDTAHLQSQLIELTTKWDKVCKLSTHKDDRLEQSLKEVFHWENVLLSIA